jgi:hypothetical protein
MFYFSDATKFADSIVYFHFLLYILYIVGGELKGKLKGELNGE